MPGLLFTLSSLATLTAQATHCIILITQQVTIPCTLSRHHTASMTQLRVVWLTAHHRSLPCRMSWVAQVESAALGCSAKIPLDGHQHRLCHAPCAVDFKPYNLHVLLPTLLAPSEATDRVGVRTCCNMLPLGQAGQTVIQAWEDCYLGQTPSTPPFGLRHSGVGLTLPVAAVFAEGAPTT